MKRKLSLSKVYGLLEPGPVVLITTALRGRLNIMTQSWHTMLDFEPPTLACVISNRNHTFGIIERTRQCVINLPTVELAKAVVGCGNTSGRTVNKFEAFGLTPADAALVEAPLIEECYANLECRVIDASMKVRYNLFVLEVLNARIDPSIKRPQTMHHLGHGSFMIAGKTIKLRSRMK